MTPHYPGTQKLLDRYRIMQTAREIYINHYLPMLDKTDTDKIRLSYEAAELFESSVSKYLATGKAYEAY